MARETTGPRLGQGSSDDLVNVAVPRRLYLEVIQFLANAMETGNGRVISPRQEQPLEENCRGWRRADVKRMKQETQLPAIVALFDLAEQNGDEPVGIAELEQSTGKTLGQVRGDLIKLTKFAEKELGLKTWPFWPEVGSTGRARYRVQANVRSWWREA